MVDRECPECGSSMAGRRRDATTSGSDACRKAGYRRKSEPAAASVPGGLQAQLETWLASQGDLPAPLVAVAVVLAGELERSPRQSALWGRYIDVLGRLVNSAPNQGDKDFEALMQSLRDA